MYGVWDGVRATPRFQRRLREEVFHHASMGGMRSRLE
jgi:hypothetical protein